MGSPHDRLASIENATPMFRSVLSQLIDLGHAAGEDDSQLRERAGLALRNALRALPWNDRDKELFAAWARRIIDEMLPEGAVR